MLTRIIKNNDEMILRDFNPGKIYITDYTIKNGQQILSTEFKFQKAQQGPTCWFYPHRARFGKKIDELKTVSSAHPEISDLLQARENEKIASTLRKKINNIHKMLTSLLEIKIIKPKKIRKKKINKAIEKIEKERAKLLQKNPDANISQLNILIEQLHDFNNYEYSTDLPFSCFLYEKFMYEEIKEYTNVLETLKLSPHKIICNYIKKCMNKDSDPPKEFFVQLDHNPTKKLQIYFLATIEILDNFLGLKKSTFNPYIGIESLMECLKKENVLTVDGYFGKNFHASKKQKTNEVIEKYEIIFLKPSTYNAENRVKHRIVVIGAEKSHKDNYVYFIDPNDNSDPNQLRQVYKITFKEFFKGLELDKYYESTAKYYENSTIIKYVDQYHNALNFFKQNKNTGANNLDLRLEKPSGPHLGNGGMEDD